MNTALVMEGKAFENLGGVEKGVEGEGRREWGRGQGARGRGDHDGLGLGNEGGVNELLGVGVMGIIQNLIRQA